MKRILRSLLALLLSIAMMMPGADNIIALALSEPFDRSELTVPEELQDGNSWYFIHENLYTVSETSSDKLYIPIQRTGDLSREGNVSLKLIDVSSKHDVTYKEEMFRESPETDQDLIDVSIMELVDAADAQEEFEEITEEEFGDAVNAQGGADLVDAEGNPVGEITAQKLDENGNPIIGEETADEEEVISEEAEETEQTEETVTDEQPEEEAETAQIALESDPSSENAEYEKGEETTGPSALRNARNEFTGTVSDRQKMEEGEGLSGISPIPAAEEATELVEDSMPGKIYNLHFEAGEDAKYLVITPLYDDAAEGDAQLMLMLKNPDDGSQVAENFRLTTISFTDEDEPQPLTLSMAEETVIAEDGKASITVSREGMKNSMAAVHLSSWGGNAVMGEDYGGVGADLYFPMGITSRTVELAVAEGEEQKDFYVTLTAVEGYEAQIGQQTVHVVIPAAGKAANLMLASAGDDTIRYGENYNLRDYARETFGQQFQYINDGEGFSVRTTDGLEQEICGLKWKAPDSYYYDGIQINYGILLNWCDADITVDTGKSRIDIGMLDGGWHEGESYTLYYGEPESPEYVRLYATNTGNEGYLFSEEYVQFVVDSVTPILRRFKVTVTDGVMIDGTKPAFAGMDEAGAKEQTAVILNDGSDDSCTVWGDDTFSISQVAGQKYVRLVGIDAVSKDGSVYRIAEGTGTSQTLVGQLNESIVNDLAEGGFFEWVKGPGGPEGSSYSRQGNLTVRPVFEYYNAKVEIKGSEYGNLVTSVEASPAMLYDFNSSKSMNSVIHGLSVLDVKPEADDDWYTFTATGSDPQFRVMMGADDVSDIQWVKVRARTSSNVDAIELFGHSGEAPLSGEECTHIDVNNDGQWHTYIINIPEENVKTANAYKGASLEETAWQGKIDWIRLDPMWNKKDTIGSGDSIDIDYIAFFPSKEQAQSFRETEGTRLAEGVYNFHIGDVLDLRTELSEAGEAAGYRGDGFRYNLYTEKNGEDISRGFSAYANGEGAIKLRGTSDDDSRTGMYYRLEPTFTAENNQLVIQVAKDDVVWLNTDAGSLGAAESSWVYGTDFFYRVASDVRSNEVYELWAEAYDPEIVPVWTGSDNVVCSGEAYYMMSGVSANDNVVKLSVSTDPEEHALYSMSGNVYAQIMNLSTGRPSREMVPAYEALVTSGYSSAVTKEDGSFSLLAKRLVGNTTVRYTVTYNGSVSIREAKTAPAGAKKQEALYFDPESGEETTVEAVPVTLNTVAVDSWSANSAHFGRVVVEQNGVLDGVVNTIQMNGKKTILTVHVEPGQPYTYNNQQYEEKITDVSMYFQNQKTKEIHGQWSINDEADDADEVKLTWDESTQTATLTFDTVSPEANALYTPGDVLMLQLSTDKKVSVSAFADHDMVYDPVSSGITMVTDLNFEPQTFNWDVSDIARVFAIQGPDESGTGPGEGYNFGRFPFLHEINAGLKIVTALSNFGIAKARQYEARQIMTALLAEEDPDDQAIGDDDIAEDLLDGDGDGNIYDVAGDEGLQPGEGSVLSERIGVAVAFTSQPTYYGGVRFAMAVVATYNGGRGFKNYKNPFANANTAAGFFQAGFFEKDYDSKKDASEKTGKMTYTSRTTSRGQQLASTFGGPRFTVGIYTGIYLDFGHVVKNGEKDGSVVCMGGGGFAGAIGNVNFTAYGLLFGLPMYIAADADIDLKFYIGVGGNPEKTLEAFREDTDIEASNYEFSFEFYGDLGAKLTFGFGVYKVLGVRVGAGVGFHAGYGNHMAEWYPLDNSNWGYTTDFTAEGTIDLIITEVNLLSLSFPLPFEDGWMATMGEVMRAKKVIAFVSIGIQDGNGSEADRAEAKTMVDELTAMVLDNQNLDRKAINDKTVTLRNYAYEHDIIGNIAYVASLTNRTGGVLGGIAEEFLYREGLIGFIPGSSSGTSAESDSTVMNLSTRDHVSAKWRNTADTSASLKGTYEPVNSQVLQSDAFSQTSSRILPLGGDKYLMVFLSDNQARDRQMAAQLVYTVYDASNNSWTEPAAVQNDSTADGKPHITDAGDKVILTWASIPDEKYAELKAEVTDELAAEGSEADDAAVIRALEADPARVMALMEIYCTEFSKESMSFSETEQLTDDNYYDDYPQAVYDSETNDYIVLYYKTSQDDALYSANSAKLMDLTGVSADPLKTYSILCYMLYNSQTDAKDTRGNTHEPGWARDYLFPNETDQDEAGQDWFLEEFKGQRFLPTAIRDMSDPAIGDLTVSEGYNGLGAFAFTVDRDYDLTTGDDRELYMQFYDFSDHKTYVPVKIAGEKTENGRTSAVDVGTPKLVRNSGDTWLFWREDGKDLRYLNVSELLNAKVASAENPGEDDWVYAVQSDGTFATDAVTGKQYTPEAGKVEFGTPMTDEDFGGTEYEVINDADDNLYVVWVDNVSVNDTDPATGEAFSRTAQEIFATAMIRQSDGSTNWSKPNRLTTDNNYNDGIAIALDPSGALMIAHNQYKKLYASSKEEVAALFESGQIGLKEANGTNYVIGSLWYNGPNSLVVTRCEPAGSVKATKFSFSHDHPIAGEKLLVNVAIENTGMSPAASSTITFYECKDGERIRRITTFESEEALPVNNTRYVSFNWVVPEEGAEGYYIEAECIEKKAEGTAKTANIFAKNAASAAYPPVITRSDAFTSAMNVRVKVNSVKQNGDVFDITYTVTNTGNLTAEDGTYARLTLCGLYGDLKERYGVDDDLLAIADLSGLEPREARTITETVEIPLSVFGYCGYDAVEAAVYTADDEFLAVSDHLMFTLENPIHLNINNSDGITLNQGDEEQLTVGFETDAFVDVTEIVYSVDDTSVAAVDENGVVTALGKGIATITATLLPSGRTISITLTVLGENGEVPEPTPAPSVEPEPTPTPTPEVKPADDKAPNTYDSYPVKYLWTGAGALLVAILAFFLRLKNRK